MGFEPLEDTLPLPQIVRTMKSITVPSDGRSCTVDYNRSSSNVDGSGPPSSQAWRQEESTGSAEQRTEICNGSERDRVWDEVEYLLGSLERTKAMLTDGTDWDPNEVKWINERYRLCKNQALNYVLCLNLSEVIQTVSFPGEQLSYLQIAERVVTGCNSGELEKAIREIGINPYDRVYFKVEAECPPLEQLEQLLLTMIGDGEYLLAKDFNERLGLSPHSASYMVIKQNLSNIGWKWKSKKIKGKVSKVIQR
jgi:hypothetical protein